MCLMCDNQIRMPSGKFLAITSFHHNVNVHCDHDGKCYSDDPDDDDDTVDDVDAVDDVDDNKLTLCTKRSPRQPELSGKQRIRDTAPMYHHHHDGDRDDDHDDDGGDVEPTENH